MTLVDSQGKLCSAEAQPVPSQERRSPGLLKGGQGGTGLSLSGQVASGRQVKRAVIPAAPSDQGHLLCVSCLWFTVCPTLACAPRGQAWACP